MSLLIVNTIQPQTGSIVNISGSLQISQSLIVADDITLSGKLTLGDANTDNIIVNSEFTSSLIPDVDGAFDLGSTVKKWGTLFAKTGSFDHLSGSINLTNGLINITSASISYLTGSSPITVGGAMIPDTNDTHDLGSATKNFRGLYVGGISASGDITSSGGTGSFAGGVDAMDATGSFGYISASGDISTSGDVYGVSGSFTILTGTLATAAQTNITSLGTITNLLATNITASGHITASSLQTNSTTINGSTISGSFNVNTTGQISASRISASNGFEADTASTSSFGHISASGMIYSETHISASGTGSFAGGILATNATGSFGSVTASSFQTNFVTIEASSISGTFTINTALPVSASRVSASHGFEADTTSTSSFGHISASGDVSSAANVYGAGTGSFIGGVVANTATGSFGAVYAGNISSSTTIYAQNTLEVGLPGVGTSRVILNGTAGHISASGKVSASGFDTRIIAAAEADAFHYSVNGRKVEVRNKLQAQLNDGTFTHLQLRNTEIATDSIVLGSFTGNTATNITGSIITAATIALYTASIQIHNETGENIADDTPFTASFIVL